MSVAATGVGTPQHLAGAHRAGVMSPPVRTVEHVAASELAHLWQSADLPAEVLGRATLTGAEPALPSTFRVSTAAQVSIAAAALAACEVGHARGQPRRQVAVDLLHAAIECMGFYSIDARVPPMWDPLSGNYRCADGWIRLHANFRHHREGALRLLGVDPATTLRADVEKAVTAWQAQELEQSAADRGLVIAAARSFEEWDASPAGQAVARQPLMTLERVGNAEALPLGRLTGVGPPLAGVRVLDLTRILAGPTCGHVLAAYGADVMLVNCPRLPNIEMIAPTSRGKLSAHVDLRTRDGREALNRLVDGGHVFLQSYTPGSLDRLGFGVDALARRRPGLIYASLSAYGAEGPWRTRRGFDSLVQTTTGIGHAEAQAAGMDEPKALPVQILDYATGFLMAFGATAALVRQQREGGSWHVRVSLAQTAHWLRRLGRIGNGLAAPRPAQDPALLETSASGFGELVAVKHSARFEGMRDLRSRPSVPPGSHAAVWP